jgi:methyl-galactoside transport system ATP-binding protein
VDQYANKSGLLNLKEIKEVVDKSIDSLDIKTPSHKTLINSLSGGNQQKVIIARWLASNPEILILDEPTRGIDVGAKYEIYQIIGDMAAEGKSIIMITSEMSELIGFSDRIMVMCEGRISGFLDSAEATQEKVMTLATKFM